MCSSAVDVSEGWSYHIVSWRMEGRIVVQPYGVGVSRCASSAVFLKAGPIEKIGSWGTGSVKSTLQQ